MIATFDLPITSRFSANGDIAFDASGNLYHADDGSGGR